MILSEDLRLQIGKEFITGFTGGQIVLSFEDAAHSFNLSMWGIATSEKSIFPYKEGADAKIYIGKDLIIDGVAESVSPNYDSSAEGTPGYGISISGRTLTGQIVDCNPSRPGFVYDNKTLLQICQDVCKPYGIDVVIDPSIASDPIIQKKFPKFSLQINEKAFEALQRAARLRGALLNTSTGRTLQITRASNKTRPVLIQGGKLPVLNASRQGSYTERFGQYLLKGQTSGTDQWYGDKAAKGEAIVTDSEIQRFRPFVILGESQEGKDALRRRAEWERNVRAGRSSRLTYTMAGWRDATGALWMPNTLVPVKDPLLDVDSTLLITRVTLIIGTKLLHAGLELCNKDAFLPEIQPEQGVSRKKGKKKLVSFFAGGED